MANSKYDERFSRNKGLLHEGDQDRLSRAHVLICGLGGMGGVCCEVLARMGVGVFTLADHDRFELSNCNRQIHADSDSVGMNKARVLGESIQRINPDASVNVFENGVTDDNVDILIEPVDVIVNGMDRMRSSLALERTARRERKTIIDAWLTPYASVFVMEPDSPHWEEYLELPTLGVDQQDLSEEICQRAVQKEVQYTLSFGEPFEHISQSLVEDVVTDKQPRPSLAPVVWLSGVLMANEVFKFLTGRPTTDHVGIIYDQYKHRMLLNGAGESV